MGLLGKVAHTLNPVHAVKQTAHYLTKDPREIVSKGGRFVGDYATNTVAELRRKPLVGAARLAISATGYGAIALTAYDAKRLADKTHAAKRKLRFLRKQALWEGQALQDKLNVLPSYTSVGPLYDQIVPPGPDTLYRGAAGPEAGTALPGPDVSSSPAPGPMDDLFAPTPDERGAGGDAREGGSVQIAGAGSGMLPLLVVGGLLAAAYVAHRRAGA